MKLVVTIYEETFDAALRAIGALNAADHDMIELRAERLGAIDLHSLRASTSKPIILTYRGMQVDEVTITCAIDAGIDFVDVEWRPNLQLSAPRDRIVLSHHDFDGMNFDLDAMRAFGCAHTKIAVTPKTLDDNLRLLECVAPPPAAARAVPAEGGGTALLSVIGMGERGLYSRILAPFIGSELTFVAASQSVAPGQLSLDRALKIYGRRPLRAKHVFAIAGNPAGHSLSPSIHNPLFRERNVAAAYTIASFETFDEIATAFERGDIRGLSITTPFKEEAFAYAQRIDAHIRSNARECQAINTLVRMRDGCIEADNTDVDGFAALIGTPKRVAIAGAGGTARAARVAAERAGAEVTIFNRSGREFPVEPLGKIREFDGDLIIDALPVEIELPNIRTIRASYTKSESTGLALLHAQAIRQNELFVEAIT
jgi:3-dehydroquinate dehydratase/shikimate dehydrogenase